VLDLDAATVAATAYQSALLIVIQVVLGGFTLVWMYGRWAAVRHAWPLVLIISAIHRIGRRARNGAVRSCSCASKLALMRSRSFRATIPINR
jgi:hypothetical protein